MKSPYLLIALALITTSFAAQDDRSKVLEGQPQVELDRIIDPDTSIFGLPLGTSEDEFMKKCGKAVGYMRLKRDKLALLYGNSMAFLFESGKLSGIFLGSDIVNYPMANGLQFVDLLDDRGWKLNNGIKNNMDLETVRKILGDKLINEDPSQLHNHYYLTDKSRVSLSFSGWPNNKDESGYALHSVLIEPKQNEAE